MTISAQGFLVHLVVVPFRQRDMNVMVRGGYKHIPDGQQDIECLGGTGKEQVSSDNHFPDIPFLQIPMASCQLAWNAGMLSFEMWMSFNNKRQGLFSFILSDCD